MLSEASRHHEEYPTRAPYLLLLSLVITAGLISLVAPDTNSTPRANGPPSRAPALNPKAAATLPEAAPSTSPTSKNSGALAQLAETDPGARVQLVESYGKLPLRFEANEGQTHERVKFLSRRRGYALFLTADEAVFALRKPSSVSSQPSDNRNLKLETRSSGIEDQKSAISALPSLLPKRESLALTVHNPQSSTDECPGSGTPRLESAVLRMKLIGVNSDAKVTGLDPLPGKSNYFIGNDPKKWRTNVQNYARVKYEGVYPGIDLEYYGNQRQLEYDFVVSPGADPKAIAFEIDTGNSKLQTEDSKLETRQQSIGNLQSSVINSPTPDPETRVPNLANTRIDASGDLVISTEAGELRFHKPLVYQPSVVSRQSSIAPNPESRTPSPGSFNRQSSISNRQFISGRFVLREAKLETRNSELEAGSSPSPQSQAPSTQYLVSFELGPYDKTLPLIIDPYVVYLAYLGGSGGDTGKSIAVDDAGNAYETGETNSVDFPLSGPYQDTPVGTDAFVTKISAAGDTLDYSTYLGGSGGDSGYDIAVDTSGSAYVAGTTTSTDFPTTSGAYKEAPPPAGYGAFVTKLSPDGASPVYSTYVAGNSAPYDACSPFRVGIAIDGGGNAYTVTQTSTSDLPTTPSAYQANIGSVLNAYVTKLNPAGSGVIYATYLGNHFPDAVLPWPYVNYSTDIAVDSSGNAYVVGSTRADYYPTTPGAAGYTFRDCYPCSGKSALFDQCTDSFVTKLNSTGTGLVYSTYLGGDNNDDAWAVAVDPTGSAYVAGETNSDTGSFPTTVDFPPGHGRRVCSLFTIYSIPCSDAFVTRLNPEGSALVYSALIGGAGPEGARAIAVDEIGNASVTGYTESADFPDTGNHFQPFPGTLPDAFIARLNPAGSALLFSSFLGGNGSDQGNGIALDGSANTYVTLQTDSTSFLVTAGSFNLFLGNDGTFRGGTGDAIAGKVSPLDSPKVGVSLINVVFPDQPVGSVSAPILVTVGNLSNVPTTVTDITAINDPSTPGADFVVGDPEGCISKALPPGEQCTFELFFSPQAAPSGSAESIKSSKRPGASGRRPIKGPGPLGPVGTRIGRCTILAGREEVIPLEGDAVETGVVVSPTSLSFPKEIEYTTSAPQDVTLTNLLGVPLTITDISASGGFAVQTSTCPLSPTAMADRASCDVSVVSTPGGEGPYTGTLTITDDGPGGGRTVALEGFGTWSQFSVSSLTFPPQLVGTGSSQTVTLKNYWPFTVRIVSVGGSGDFGAGGCEGLLDPSVDCTISVGFNPRQVGKRFGVLTVYIGLRLESDTGGPYETHYLDLMGTGFLHPVAQINQPIAPAGAIPGRSGFTLNLVGTGFVSDSMVAWNGSARSTTYVDSTHLTATISAGDVAAAGTVSITVQTPSSVGSNVIPFPIANPITHVSLARLSYPSSTGPSFVAVADFNADGKLDWAVANYVASTVSVYLGAGDGTSTHLGDYATGSGPAGIATGDYNRDGKVDLVVSAGIGVSVLLGNGAGAFPSRVDYETGANPSSVTAGDFNADGYLDVVVTNGDSNTLSVLMGYGDATFQGHVDYATANQPKSVTAGDFNQDGILDLAIANSADGTVSVLLGKGDGTFDPQTTYPTGAGPAALLTADFNQDGKLDLAVANGGSNTISLLLGNGNGTFQPQAESVSGPAPSGLAVGDFNSDGKLDLAVANTGDDTLTLLLGSGSGSFTTYSGYPTGAHPTGLAVGDFSADGRLDFAIAARDDDAVSVLVQSPLGLTPASSISFSPQVVGTASVAKSVTLTNSGNLALSLSSVGIAGGNSEDFGLTHDCPLSPDTLAASTSCTINVTFTPTVGGPRKSSVVIAGDAVGSPYRVLLTGVGTAVSVAPTSWDFGDQGLGSTSSAKAITLTNVGSASIHIWSMAVTGAQSGDFHETNNCPIPPATLGGGASCTVSVTFAPAALGARSAVLQVSHDGGASPSSVPLAGTGIPPEGGAINVGTGDERAQPKRKTRPSSTPRGRGGTVSDRH